VFSTGEGEQDTVSRRARILRLIFLIYYNLPNRVDLGWLIKRYQETPSGDYNGVQYMRVESPHCICFGHVRVLMIVYEIGCEM
jgi:hypothetical protein